MKNTLYYGDNLDILRRYIPDESIDLIYLDPPFKSGKDYNILFEEKNGSKSRAQIKAFEDTWYWDKTAEETYLKLIETAPNKLVEMLEGFRYFLGISDIMSYLVMMAIRLLELKRVLKETGSIYLHCDPAASHYLKLVLDAIFGVKNFRNEIIWRRSTDTGSSKAISKKFPMNSDTILYYTNSDKFTFNTIYKTYGEDYLKRFKYKDEKGRFRWQCLKTYSQKTLDKLKLENRIRWGRKAKYPEYKQYDWELKGVLVSNIWTDINQINPAAKERLGYPTQKPETLLERIILASSDENDIVLDPFCGCGTTITVSQKLKRRWIGIDITHLAISLIKHRLEKMFGESCKYKTIGEPVDISGARELSTQDRYQFQYWALGLVKARPVEEKKGADKGIDGIIYFQDSPKEFKKIIIQVKSGHVNRGMIDSLKGVIEREKAQIGVFITLKKPTKPMIKEAVSSGFYESETYNKNYPKIQILTIKDLLNGKKIEYPGVDQTLKEAKRFIEKKGEQLEM